MWSILDLLRTNPEKIEWSLTRRSLDLGMVDQARTYDRLWRESLQRLDELRHERNMLSKEIPSLKGEDKEAKIKRAKELTSLIEDEEKVVNGHKRHRDETLLGIPNIVHETVPLGRDEEDNVPIRFSGTPDVWREDENQFLSQVGDLKVKYNIVDSKPLAHADIGEGYGLTDTERAGKIAGTRFYYLIEELVWLDLALTLYAADYLVGEGFTLVEPPSMMRRKAYEGVIGFGDFEDMLYKIEGEDLYLIATSEHPLAAMYMSEVIEKEALPLTYVGFSPCFRREAGAHGKDTKGIFRVHQFNKVEQFVYCLPEESWIWFDKLISNAEQLWSDLGLPYRIVKICTGELGPVAAKKYDLEVWMPAQGKFREVVSCSNCTDYQSARLNTRYAERKGAPSMGFVHTLNSTAIATSRAITAILENWQEEDGTITIPPTLRQYLKTFRNAPHDTISPRSRK
ncbi:MAG: serine--tRNA ligase [Nitrososphaeria archaeon]|nr:serine--tRNA ligase [Nitrososphaeria archaeon]NIN52022.1 serine--tRNA ligase [Nitrososphaeria archaeon]NIQ32484.1 serine--tRNA ligase [Nitrososphaeria archaeon]